MKVCPRLARKPLRAARISVVAALLTLAIWAPAVKADPLAMTFTEGRANVGMQLSDDALFEAPEVAPFEAQMGPAGESISEGALQVPQFSTHITDPINADVAVDFDIGVISGTFVQATGGLSLSGEAGGTLAATGHECIVSTTPSILTLSSSGSSGGTSPRAGVPFVHGLTGAGAIAGEWTDMQATPVDTAPGGDTFFCEEVEKQIEGPGGIWLRQQGDVVAPSAPQLTGTDPAAPGGLSDTPRILGTAEANSTVRIYAGADCAGIPVATTGAAELASPGITVSVESGTASFSATATDPAGNTSVCSAPIAYTRLHGDPPPPPPVCVVPKLGGKTLGRAKAALTAAGCKLGTISKPRPRKGKKLGRLVVKFARPGAGTALPFASRVDLRLGRRAGGHPRG
jgi:hypothetical protein